MLVMLAMLAESLWIEVLDLTCGLKIELGVRHAFGQLARRILQILLFVTFSVFNENVKVVKSFRIYFDDI